MAILLALVYLGGWLGTVVVDRYRIGLTQRGTVSLETAVTSLPWAVTTIGKMLVWPLVLVVWLARGRPASPWKVSHTRSGGLRVRRVVERG